MKRKLSWRRCGYELFNTRQGEKKNNNTTCSLSQSTRNKNNTTRNKEDYLKLDTMMMSRSTGYRFYIDIKDNNESFIQLEHRHVM